MSQTSFKSQTKGIPYDCKVEYVGNHSTSTSTPETGSGIEYVDLGIALPEEFTFFIDMNRKSHPSYVNNFLFGNTSSSANSGFAFKTNIITPQFKFGSQTYSLPDPTSGKAFALGRQTVMIEVTPGQQVVRNLMLDTGNEYESALAVPYAKSPLPALLLCDPSDVASKYSKFQADVYECWIKDKADNFILKLIPCVKDSIAYFYDAVSGRLLGNAASTGDLIPGPQL